jgi:hypothetical protein
MGCAKGGYLDDLSAEPDVNELKATPDQSRIAKQFVDLFGMGFGGNIKVFGVLPQLQITNATADEIGLVSSIFQAI